MKWKSPRSLNKASCRSNPTQPARINFFFFFNNGKARNYQPKEEFADTRKQNVQKSLGINGDFKKSGDDSHSSKNEQKGAQRFVKFLFHSFLDQLRHTVDKYDGLQGFQDNYCLKKKNEKQK